jgi:hypothetical protein
MEVAHEVGHCLGLLHTHHEDGCEDLGGSNCGEMGDLVCDTPPDDGQYGNPTNCDENDPLAVNIMSYYPIRTCPDRFTVGQGERMRHYLENRIGVLGQVVLEDIIISDTKVYNSPMDISANIIIRPGGTLTVNAPVKMQENAYIYVEANDDIASGTPGGRLLVYSLITTGCPDKLWQGVIVDGEKLQDQSTQKQARLFLGNGGIIEHSRIGARVIGNSFATGEPLNNASGGVVVSLLGQFRDNIVDVYFAPYEKRNSSLFLQTTFSTTNNYRGGALAPTHVELNGVFGLKLLSCRFEDLRTNLYSIPETRGLGIKAEDANFSVSGTSVFTNLFEGVNVREISGLIGNSVVGATFNRCFTGISSFENNNFVFNGNVFNMERPSNFTGAANRIFKGLELEGKTRSFMVSGNQFISMDGSLIDRYIGTDVLAVTTDNNSILNNYYENLHISNRARGENAIVAEMLFSGLMYECNVYENNIEHDHLVANGAIRREQGPRNSQNARIASGNRYNETFGPPLLAQQFTNAGQGIDYHHRDIIDSPERLIDGFYTPATVLPINAFPNLSCGTGGETGCPNPPCSEVFLASAKAQFFQKKQVWHAKRAAFPSITNTTTILSEARAINQLRLTLDRLGNTILLHHALDTTGIKQDSVLTWLGHLDSYDADMQLARYHFFAGNYALADNLLAEIPDRYTISGGLLVEFENIVAILEAIRQTLQDTIPLHNLPASLLDTIANTWGNDCSAAGALARDLLYRNNIRIYPVCDPVEQRSTAGTGVLTELLNEDIRVFPNPANKFVTIERGKTDSELLISFIHLSTGQVCLPRTFQPKESFMTVDLSQLAPGGYAIMFQNGNGVGQAKLVVFH